MRMKTFLALLVAFCATSGIAAWGEDTPALVETEVARVALFKNGYGYFTCEGALPRGADRIRLDRVPLAALGTLWIASTDLDASVVDARVVRETETSVRPVTSFDELIRNNVGKSVRIVADEEFVGEILPFPESPGPEPDVPQLGHGPVHVPVPPPTPQAAFFLLRTAEGKVTALRFGDVRRLELDDDGVFAREVETENRYLECRLESPAGEGAVFLHYLQAGASWTPGYEIRLVDDDTAEVSLKATVINDVEDLVDAELRFVVGYPNFMYADVYEPLTGDQPLREFLEALSRRPDGGRGSRRAVMAQQAMSNVAYYEEEVGAMPALPEQGEFKEDLFFYPPVTATVKKGERLSFVLSESQSPYRHVYTWDVPDTIPLNRSGYYQQPEEEQAPEVIWHNLRIENEGKQPWTTGPALIVQDGLPLGQDMLKYTSVGGQTLVRITKATDVAAEKRELEVERTPNAKEIYGYRCDLIEVRGELSLQNKRTQPVHVVVTKSVTGEVTSTTPEAKVSVRAEGLQPINPRCVLEWEVDLDSGQDTKLTYDVDVYMRH